MATGKWERIFFSDEKVGQIALELTLACEPRGQSQGSVYFMERRLFPPLINACK